MSTSSSTSKQTTATVCSSTSSVSYIETGVSAAAQEAVAEKCQTPTQPLKVAILAGGFNHEREISLRSARRVANELEDRGQIVKIIDIDGKVLVNLNNFAPDVVWPLVHGKSGEDGTLQDLLALTDYPFVGTLGGACRIAFSKRSFKSLLHRAGIKVPDGKALPQDLFKQLGARAILELVSQSFEFPVVVKPNKGGSALGVNVVNNPQELPNAMVNAYVYADEVLIERYIPGVEVAVSVVEIDDDGPRALPPVEINSDGFYDFEARYTAGHSEFFIPARLSAQVSERVSKLAVEVHKLLCLRDLSRIDLIVDTNGTPWVIDVNTAPGMTETSLFPLSARANQGFVGDLFLSLIRSASHHH